VDKYPLFPADIEKKPTITCWLAVVTQKDACTRRRLVTKGNPALEAILNHSQLAKQTAVQQGDSKKTVDRVSFSYTLMLLLLLLLLLSMLMQRSPHNALSLSDKRLT